MLVRKQSSGAPRLMSGRSAAAVSALAVGLACAPTGAALAALPDGRAYERVSPVEKSGSEAGARSGDGPSYSLATTDGSRLLYFGSGAQGEDVQRGIDRFFTADRTSSGWVARAAIPGAQVKEVGYFHQPLALQVSDDLRRFLFNVPARYLTEQPPALPFSQNDGLILGETGGPLTWVTRPTNPDPVPKPEEHPYQATYWPSGGAPDLGRFYFAARAILTPEDEVLRPFAGTIGSFYVYEAGQLRNAGVLPDGTIDPEGAAPAGATHSPFYGGYPGGNQIQPDFFNNQVSADGTKALFVSPDPNAGSSRPSQLYLRTAGAGTVLVSKLDGTETPAPSGAAWAAQPNVSTVQVAYAYGARDGSAVIFQSVDPLTADAPNDGTTKRYRYDVASDAITYLPGAAGTVLAAADDLSRFLVLSEDLSQIRVWSRQGGTKVISPITLPGSQWVVSPARATSNGSTFAFETNGTLPGHPNPGEVAQVFRYDVASDALTCVSCPADGSAPTGHARLSNTTPTTGNGALRASRGISGDGKWIFFDTVDSLRPKDVNGKRDVYRWHDGAVELLTTGTSSADSYLLDNGVDGRDVFFATREGLLPDDTDGGYDVYDARIGGGFPVAVTPPRCTECQGPPPPPPGATSPASGSFTGPGNLAEEAERPPVRKVAIVSRKTGRTSIVLRVKAPSAGRISITGDRLRATRRTARRAATYTVTVRLSSVARRLVQRRGRLGITARVRFVPESGPATSTSVALTVKR